MDGDDGQREGDGAFEHDGHEVARLHATVYQPACQYVGTARQFSVSHTVGGIGHSQAVGRHTGTLLEGLDKGHLRVDVQVLARAKLYEGVTFLVADDVEFAERCLRMSYHVVDCNPDGFGHHLQGCLIVHGQTGLHAYFIAVAFQIDIHTEVGVDLFSYGLHGTYFGIAEHHMLLHVGHGQEIELDTRLHAEVRAEVGEGVDAIADGAHELAALALHEIDNPL